MAFANSDAPIRTPCLHGTFVQIDGDMVGWNRARWQSLFDSLHALQIELLIVQWSVHADTALYPSSRFSAVQTVPLTVILALADRAGMRVMVGLSHDPRYWDAVEGPGKRSYLANRLKKNRMVATELVLLVAQHPSFAGWYISEEIDDENWHGRGDQQALFTYVQQLSAFLHDLSPHAEVGISGFASGHTSPAAVGTFWRELLNRADAVRTVYFQDGIGVANLNFGNIDAYFQAIKSAVDANHREFVPVVELFRQTAGEPISEAEFAAVPTDISRLLRQIGIAERYAGGYVMFAVPDYMTPTGDANATLLYNDYINNRRVKNTTCRRQ